ncbi:MAG: hypothetical protein KGM98_03685, partial [Bacteroidota bacterium]|nr:hypothetical protein [Bacteroidota bacterium]
VPLDKIEEAEPAILASEPEIPPDIGKLLVSGEPLDQKSIETILEIIDKSLSTFSEAKEENQK